MRFHRLEFENLNSLYGSHVIDFDADFADASLLLISGDTGAGKSTILDAIHLALFATTPRLVAGRSDDATSPEHIMSRSTGKASVVLEFSVLNGVERVRYRAGWSQRRARERYDGKAQAATRELQRYSPTTGTWEILVQTTKVSEANAAFDEALQGLKAPDFQRCVLLAQGRFDALLSASIDERKSILERVIDVERYRKVGEEIARRQKEAKERYEDLQRRLKIGADELLSDESYAALRADEEALRSSLETQSQTLKALDLRLQWTNELARLEAALSAATEAYALAHRRVEETQDGRAALAMHDLLEPLVVLDRELVRDLAEIETAQSDLARLRDVETELRDAEILARQVLEMAATTAQTQEAELEAARPQLDAAQRAWESFAQKKAKTESQRALALVEQKRVEANQHAQSQHQEKLAGAKRQYELHQEARAALTLSEDALRREDDVDTRLEALRDAVKNYRALTAQVGADRAKLAAAKSALETLQAARDAKAQALQTQEVALQNTLSAALADVWSPGDGREAVSVDSLLEEARQHEERLSEQARHVEQWRRERSAWESASGLVRELQQKRQAAEASLARADEAHARKEEARAASSAEHQRVLGFLASAEEFLKLADRLQDHEPCPLCGSPDHVASDERSAEMRAQITRFQDQVTALEGVLKEHQEGVKALAKEQLTLQKELAALQPQERAQTDAIAQSERAMSELAVQSKALGLESDALRELAMDAFAGRVAELQAQRASLEATRMRAAEESRRVNALRVALASDDAELRTLQTTMARDREELHALDAALATAAQAQQTCVEAAEALLGELAWALPNDENTESDGEAGDSYAIEVGKVLRLVKDAMAPLREALMALERARRDVEVSTARCEESAAEGAALAQGWDTAKLEVARAQAEETAAQSELQNYFGGRAPAEVRAQLESAWKTALDEVTRARTAHEARATAVQAQATKVSALSASLTTRTDRYNEGHALLQEKLASFALASREALHALRLAEADAEAWRVGLREIDRQLDEATTRLGVASEQQTVHAQSPPPGGPADEQSVGQRELVELELEQGRLRLGALTQQLTQDDERRARLAQSRDAIDSAKANLERWTSIYDVAGVRNGDRFVALALALCMGELIHYANMNLRMLSSRYELCQRQEDGVPILDFEIADLEQSGLVRPISTLSGGERFILSLALALGLGNTVRSKLRFETLMIDEGFGTLDADTLRKVISTLEALQLQTGAQVMLISHVAMLGERIPAQIQVHKRGGGRSEIRTRTA